MQVSKLPLYVTIRHHCYFEHLHLIIIVCSVQVRSNASKLQQIEHWGVGEQTICDLAKTKDELIFFSSSSNYIGGVFKRKAMKRSAYDALDTAMFE